MLILEKKVSYVEVEIVTFVIQWRVQVNVSSVEICHTGVEIRQALEQQDIYWKVTGSISLGKYHYFSLFHTSFHVMTHII